MVIDVITEFNICFFGQFLVNGKEFSGEILCIMFRKFSAYFDKISSNYNSTLIMRFEKKWRLLQCSPRILWCFH